MIHKTGLGWLLWALAAGLFALSVVGSVALWGGDHSAVGVIAIIQAPLYVAASWLVIARPPGSAIQRRALASILLVGLAMRLVAIPAPPASSDLYRYIWDGRVQATGTNPYRYVPADEVLRGARDEAIYPHINRADYAPTIYPPAAQIIFLGITRISESPVVMKAAMVAFEVVAIWAMLQLFARRGLPPTRVLVYVWHPLPIWEFAGSGHVDAIAIAFLLLAFVAVDRRSPVIAGVALAAGVLVKYFPVVAAPALYKRWDWRLPAAFIVTAALLYLPYLGVGSRVFGFLTGYVAEEGFAGGSGIFLWTLLGSLVSLPSGAFAFYFPAAAVILAAIALFFAVRRQQPDADILAATVLAFAFLILLSPHYPWYFAWLIPFLCFYPFAAGLYLTCAASYLHLSDWPPSLRDGGLIYGVTLAALVAELLYRHVKKEERHGRAVPAQGR